MKNIQKVILMGGMVFALTFNTVPVAAATYSAVELTDEAVVKVITGDIPTIEKEGTLAPITISERYIGSLTGTRTKADRTITLSLKGTNYSFASETPKITYAGGFKDINEITVSYGETDGKEDKQILEFVLPYDKGVESLGTFQITNLKVVSEKVVEGDLTLQIQGSSEIGTDIKVAQVKSYGATLKALDTNLEDVVAGDAGNFSFSITEGMPDSFIPGRTIEFTLSKGYFGTADKKDVIIGAILVNGKDISKKAEITPIIEGDRITGFEFTLPELDRTISNEITFKNVLVYADVTQKGNVVLNMDGRGVDKGDSIVIGQIKSPIATQVEGFKAQVGIKNQIGGKVTISETSKSMLNRGLITLEIESQNGITFRGEPDVEVVEGDLKVNVIGWDDENPNLLTLRVVQKSSQPSVLEISNFRVNVSEIVPDGKYALTIGGSAIAPEAEGTLKFDGFLTTKYEETNTNTNGGSNNSNNNNNNNSNDVSKKTITKFTVGNQSYIINEETHTMDAAPYIESGRTMVPLRYAVAAAGVNPDDVEFSKGVITVPASKLIKMTLGSNIVTADGKEYTMVTAPSSVNGRTYIPISELASILDLSVSWDKETKTATFEY
nr:stalk domain-containing protein [uncultured Cellulosilyticum sp.]